LVGERLDHDLGAGHFLAHHPLLTQPSLPPSIAGNQKGARKPLLRIARVQVG
jgi:hypothetical protein